jgi:hypothetical protein
MRRQTRRRFQTPRIDHRCRAIGSSMPSSSPQKGWKRARSSQKKDGAAELNIVPACSHFNILHSTTDHDQRYQCVKKCVCVDLFKNHYNVDAQKPVFLLTYCSGSLILLLIS